MFLLFTVLKCKLDQIKYFEVNFDVFFFEYVIVLKWTKTLKAISVQYYHASMGHMSHAIIW